MAKRTLTVNLSEEVVSVLRELARDSGSTLTEEIQKAIQDRKYFVSKLAEGEEVVLERHSGDVLVRTSVDLR